MAQYASTQPTGYKNHLQNIAIVGAGGRAGKYIVTSLLSNGVSQKITALTRADSSTTFAPGVQTAHIDYTHPSTIVSALRGQDVLIITMSVMAAPDSSKKLIEAAAEAGVKWVLPNEWGFDASNEEAGKDSMIYEAKKADRELIESLGVSSWIGIACGFWYEFSLGGGDIRYVAILFPVPLFARFACVTGDTGANMGLATVSTSPKRRSYSTTTATRKSTRVHGPPAATPSVNSSLSPFSHRTKMILDQPSARGRTISSVSVVSKSVRRICSLLCCALPEIRRVTGPSAINPLSNVSSREEMRCRRGI